MAPVIASLNAALAAAGLNAQQPGVLAAQAAGAGPASWLDTNPAASPDPVLAWNQAALDVVSSAAAGPTPSSRLYALLNTALYDAWALFDAKASPYLFNPAAMAATATATAAATPLAAQVAPLAASTLALGLNAVSAASAPTAPLAKALPLREAVMAVAAHEVLLFVGGSLFATGQVPEALRTRIDALQTAALDALGSAATGFAPLQAAAVALGKQVATAIETAALQDGSNQAFGYADTTGYAPTFEATAPGEIPRHWQPLVTPAGSFQKALTPQWGGVKPFAVGRDLVPPSILTPYDANNQLNPAFVAEMQQVLDLSANLTDQQKASADFWEDGRGTSYPPGTWIGFTNELIRERNLGLDDAVKLAFGVGQAVFDAGIATWATKYTFDSVRPISAIRSFYADKMVSDWRGKPVLGKFWSPYIPTPAFPDVASGHSTFSAAAATVLRNFLGSNLFRRSIPQTFRNADAPPGTATLEFRTLSDTAEQAGFSRLLGGIHMNEGNWQGQKIGAQVGASVSSKAQSLFNGGAKPITYSQQFGTMAADVITGQEAIDSRSTMEVYALGGDDTLISSLRSEQNLFGGEGRDTFRLRGGRAVTIRDLEPGETIEVPLLRFAGLRLEPSKLGSSYTDLNAFGRVLAHLDGQWTADQLNLTSWA